MTPEERAERIIKDLAQQIRIAIIHALQQERQRCAGIANAWATYEGSLSDGDTARRIAREISGDSARCCAGAKYGGGKHGMSETQIPLCEAPRPTYKDRGVILAAAEKVARDVFEWIGKDARNTTIEELVRVFAEMDLWQDGYELAREMEQNGWCGVNTLLVDVMDEAKHHLSSACDEAVTAWLLATERTPQLPVGTKVRVSKARVTLSGGRNDELEGEIVDIDPKRGTYVVCIPSRGHILCPNIGSIFAWEEVEGWNAGIR